MKEMFNNYPEFTITAIVGLSMATGMMVFTYAFCDGGLFVLSLVISMVIVFLIWASYYMIPLFKEFIENL